jgi:hypothetical protein
MPLVGQESSTWRYAAPKLFLAAGSAHDVTMVTGRDAMAGGLHLFYHLRE